LQLGEEMLEVIWFVGQCCTANPKAGYCELWRHRRPTVNVIWC